MLQKFAPIVKRQLEYWQRQIDQYGPDHPRYRPAKIERYRQLVADFTELFDSLNRAEGTDLKVESARPARLSPEKSKPLFSTPKQAPNPTPIESPVAQPPDEFAGLPPELLAELSEGVKAQVDPIIKAINDRGGTATLDHILIDLYRATGEVNKRTVVQNKLFRLSKRELCWSVPGKKGTYTTTQPEGVDNSKLVPPRQSKQDTKSEDPPAATDGPSRKDVGVAGLPGGPSKASEVGPTPTTSTVLHRHQHLMSGVAAANLFPWEPKKKK